MGSQSLALFLEVTSSDGRWSYDEKNWLQNGIGSIPLFFDGDGDDDDAADDDDDDDIVWTMLLMVWPDQLISPPFSAAWKPSATSLAVLPHQSFLAFQHLTRKGKSQNFGSEGGLKALI